MTNDIQSETQTQPVEPPQQASHTHPARKTDNHGKTNWAWAHDGSGYDWMDSHYFPFDFV